MSGLNIPHVAVTTAVALIASKDDPYRILVGRSAKHEKPVLPGGKIERDDIESDNLQAAGEICVIRETGEETGAALLNPRYIGKATDAKRDVRMVPYSKIKTSLFSPALPDSTPDNALIKASYGCPDFVYTGTIDESAIATAEELKGLRFIDIRDMKIGDLSAGHDIVVLAYRQMLDNGQTHIAEDLLLNFDEDRKRFAAPYRNDAAPASTADSLDV